MTTRDANGSAYLLRRSDLARTVRDSEGFSVHDAIVDKADLNAPNAWLHLINDLNTSQRTVVSVVEVHAHAQFNGLASCLEFHGPELLAVAADGAARLGATAMEAMLRKALTIDLDWDELEEQWDRKAAFEIESFIEANANDFFVE